MKKINNVNFLLPSKMNLSKSDEKKEEAEISLVYLLIVPWSKCTHVQTLGVFAIVRVTDVSPNRHT